MRRQSDATIRPRRCAHQCSLAGFEVMSAAASDRAEVRNHLTQINAVLGEMQIYIDAADPKRRARRAIELLEKAQKRNTKVSKRASRLDKSTKK
jgi:hypothetical protein